MVPFGFTSATLAAMRYLMPSWSVTNPDELMFALSCPSILGLFPAALASVPPSPNHTKLLRSAFSPAFFWRLNFWFMITSDFSSTMIVTMSCSWIFFGGSGSM